MASKNIKYDLTDLSDDDLEVVLYHFACDRFLEKSKKSMNAPYADISMETVTGHIGDWIKAAVINKAHWLTNVNENGIPKKLAKLSSLELAFAEANKSMRRENQRLLSQGISTQGEQLYKTLSNDFYIVRLISPEALDNESRMMQHCIGQGAYDQHLEHPDTGMFLSLRDQYNKAHATLEIKILDDGNELYVQQMQGKQNNFPVDKYLSPLMEFFTDSKINCSRYYSMIRKLKDEDGIWYDFDNLPDGLVFNHGFNVKYIDKIGNELYFKKSVEVSNGINDFVIGDNLKSDEDVYICAHDFKIGNNAFCGGNLTLVEVDNITLGDNVYIEGDLRFKTSNIKAGNNIHVNGTLNMPAVYFEDLPSSITYNGLSLYEPAVEIKDYDGVQSLQKGKTHYSRLDIPCHPDLVLENNLVIDKLKLFPKATGGNIKSLPEKMTVTGNMMLRGVGDNSADHLISLKQWNLSGEVYIHDSVIESLPDILKVKVMSIRNSKIFNMPSEIQIEKGLSIFGSQINSLPKKIHATTAKLLLDNTNITEIPDGTFSSDYRGFIFIINQELVSIPNDLHSDVKIIVYNGSSNETYSPDEYNEYKYQTENGMKY